MTDSNPFPIIFANVIRQSLKRRLDIALLAIVFLVFASSTILWTIEDKTPPPWDPADHISAGFDYYRPLAHLDMAGFARLFFQEERYYAPLVHLVTAVIFLLFDASRVTGIGVNLLSLAMILYAVAWIARRLFLDASSEASHVQAVALPVLAALLATSYHFSAWLLHDAFLDYPLTAAVTVGFALLIRAGDFTSRRNALIFGLAAGLGLLVKQTFVFFFILPAIYVVFNALRARSKRAFANLLLAGLVALCVAAIWYGPHLSDVIAIYRVNREAAANENEAPLFSFMSNAFYVHALLSHQMQVPFAILLVIGLVYSLIHLRRESVMLYLWLVGGIIAFTFIANKDVRYTVPVLPAAALLSVCWIREFYKSRFSTSLRYVRLLLIIATAIWAGMSFFNAQWPRDGAGYYWDTPRFRWMVFARNYYGFDHRPLSDDWSVPEIVMSVYSDSQSRYADPEPPALRKPVPEETVSPLTSSSPLRRPRLGVVVNLPHLNPSSLGLYSRLLSQGRAGLPLIDVEYIVVERALDRLEGCDYLLVRTGLESAEWVAPVERVVEQSIAASPSKFLKVASLPIPVKGAEAVIYRMQR